MTEKCWENIAKNAAFDGGRGGALKCHGWKWNMGAKVCRCRGIWVQGLGLGKVWIRQGLFKDWRMGPLAWDWGWDWNWNWVWMWLGLELRL